LLAGLWGTMFVMKKTLRLSSALALLSFAEHMRPRSKPEPV
jgi:hypothetical protein